MKNESKNTLESGRPMISAIEAVNFCLEQLYADKTKLITDECCNRLTYEEIIGALLLARDLLERKETEFCDDCGAVMDGDKGVIDPFSATGETFICDDCNDRATPKTWGDKKE
jgi:hypothetical protein